MSKPFSERLTVPLQLAVVVLVAAAAVGTSCSDDVRRVADAGPQRGGGASSSRGSGASSGVAGASNSSTVASTVGEGG